MDFTAFNIKAEHTWFYLKANLLGSLLDFFVWSVLILFVILHIHSILP